MKGVHEDDPETPGTGAPEDLPEESIESDATAVPEPSPELEPEPSGASAAGLASSVEADTVDLEEPDISLEDVEDEDDDASSLVGQIPWEPADSFTIAFAGGKGGAGRSLLAANIGLVLSGLGREVVLADLDPSGSNLHTYLGLEPLLPSPGALLRDPGPPRVDLVPNTNLRLCRPPWPMGADDDPLRLEALEAALDSKASVVILDLGAQADALTLDTFLNADAGVVVVVPDPAAIERAYAFVRSALYRRLLHGDDEPAVVARALLGADRVGQLDTPADLVAALSGVHPNAAEAVRARVMAFTPMVLMNKCRTRADREMSQGLVSALRRRWGLNAISLGGVEYDEAAWEATRRRRPLMVEYPGSTFSDNAERLARRLLGTIGRDVRPEGRV